MSAGNLIAIIIIFLILIFIIIYLVPGTQFSPQTYTGKVLKIEIENFNSTFEANETKIFNINISNVWKYDVNNLSLFASVFSLDWEINGQKTENVKFASEVSLPVNSYKNFEIKIKAPNIKGYKYPFEIIATYNTTTKLSAQLKFAEDGRVLEKRSDGIFEISEIKTNFSSYGLLPINISLNFDSSKFSILRINSVKNLENCNILERKIISCDIEVPKYEKELIKVVEIEIFFNATETLFSSQLTIV